MNGGVSVRVRKLTVRHFRGIGTATWDIPSERLLCLVGQADSTKSTILEALAAVLSDRPYVRFDECDFHNADMTQPILIEVAVVDIPAELHTDTAFGLHLSGIWSDNSLTHDPLDDPECEECLVIRLTVDKSTEAAWEVVRPGGEETVRISASQRARPTIAPPVASGGTLLGRPDGPFAAARRARPT